MRTNLKVLAKINEARIKIKDSDLKKLGRNNHSHYDYYTPEQVSVLTSSVCSELGLINLYNLKRTELGLVAELTVVHLESGEIEVFEAATDSPSIKATNISQQLGGAMTYSERYLLMFAYDIKDNNLDFDTPVETTKKENVEAIDKTLSVQEVENKWNGKIYKDNCVYIDNVKYKISDEQIVKLKSHSKYKK